MRNYSLKTLQKMLSKAESRLYEETKKPCGNWGDGMRLSKLPQCRAWEKAYDGVQELKKQIENKKSETENKTNGKNEKT